MTRVDLVSDGLTLTLGLDRLYGDMAPPGLSIVRSVPVRMKRRGVEMRMVIPERMLAPNTDLTLVKAIARARRWADELIAGMAPNITAIAAREGVDERYVSRLLPLAFLSPAITEAIVEGRQPIELTAQALIGAVIPADWRQQDRQLGF